MSVLERLKQIDPVNREYLAGYERELEVRNVQKSTIESKMWRTYIFLKALGFKDAKVLQRRDIENFIIDRKKLISPITLQGEILEARLFIRWLDPDREKTIFPKKMQRVKKILPVERLVTQQNITTLLEACTNQRDRALLMILWDSGARVSEILDRKVGDVQFDQYGAVIIVNGKTGQRRLRLTDSVPDLQAWINVHPLRHNPKAPLFVTQRRYGSSTRVLDIRTVQNHLKAIGRRAGVPDIHPHALRHARLTDLAKQGFSEMELRIIAGWEKSSTMPEVYIHLSGADVEKKILERAGIVAKSKEEESKLIVKICPRCKATNAFDAIYCKSCSLALTVKALREIEIMQQLINNPDDLIAYAEWRKRQRN